MMQPLGFKDPTQPNSVCMLNKAIYGLKQTPRVWYFELQRAIMDLGFSNSKPNTSLFIYNRNSVLCYLLVYIDDLVVIKNNFAFMSNIVTKLGAKFSLKDMGSCIFS